MVLPLKRNVPYGLSSRMMILYFKHKSYIALLFSSEVVIQVGFWKVGIIYSSLGAGVLCIASSNNPKFIPSLSTGTPSSLASLLINPFSAPTNVGSSTMILSPGFKNTLAAISSPSPEPEVTIRSSFSVKIFS